MKRLFLTALLLLTSCTSDVESKSIESFAPCSEIATTSSTTPTLVECLENNSTIDINAIKGPAVISVWASWCTNCEAQRPNFIRLYEESAGRFQVIGVDVEEQKKTDGFDHAHARGMSYPQLFDPDGRTSTIFGPGVPITRFIDANNQIAHQTIGPILEYEELVALVKQHLGIDI
jgi:thiol-disulfide isomerase/thioredoxin